MSAQHSDTNPTLSVIVLQWDQVKYTQACVESIRRHTDVSYELILVDNGSGSTASSYAEQAADVAVLNEENLGFAAGMNRGLDVAQGRYVVFANNDTVFPPGWASRLLATFEKHPLAGIAVPAVTAAGNERTVRSQTRDAVEVLPKFQTPPSGVVYLMDTEVARKLGGWDERFSVASAEDIDLCFRTWVNGLDIVFDQAVLVEHAAKATAVKLPDHEAQWAANRRVLFDKWVAGRPDVPHLGTCSAAEFERNLDLARSMAAWMQRYFAVRDRLPRSGRRRVLLRFLRPIARTAARLEQRIRRTRAGRRARDYAANNLTIRRVWGLVHKHAGRLPSEYGDPPPRTYTDFAGYLSYAVVDPLMTTPFSEADHRVLGVMDSRHHQLARTYASRPHRPLVSVILPTYNRLYAIRSAIASVVAQTYREWELIVVDDGSTDGTSDFVNSFDDGRVRLVRVHANQGVARARNTGHAHAHAQGEIVAYLDSDNTWHEDYLLVLVGMLHDHPAADVAYCAQNIWRTTAEGREKEGVRFAPFNRSLLEHRNYIDLNAFVHRRSILDRLGGFNESLPRLSDWDLLLRYTAGSGALAVPCVLSDYEHVAAGDQLTTTLPWDEARRSIFDLVDQNTLPFPTSDPEDDATSLRVSGPQVMPDVDAVRDQFAIVMPSFEALPYLRVCVESVLRYTDDDYRLILVDNGSGDDVLAYLRSVEADKRVTLLLNETNLGFTHAVNQGIQEAGARDIVLLNNDAVVTPGWVRAMWKVFDDVPEAGIAVPRQILFARTDTMVTHVPFARVDRELDVTLSAHHRNVIDPSFDWHRGYMEMSFAPFFCVYIRREVIEEIGILNAEHGVHYRSDRVYCDTVRHFAKRRIIYTPHSKVYHFLQQSTKQLRRDNPNMYGSIYGRNVLPHADDARAAVKAGQPESLPSDR